jgi:rubredoxin
MRPTGKLAAGKSQDRIPNVGILPYASIIEHSHLSSCESFLSGRLPAASLPVGRLVVAPSSLSRFNRRSDPASAIMKAYMCVICGYVYEEEKGDPNAGLAPGTRWEDVPLSWRCPDCGAGKEDFEMVEI